MHDCGCSSHNGFLTERGLAELAQRELELNGDHGVSSSVSGTGRGSVSGLERERDVHVFDDDLIDQQCRRHHHGS